MKIKMKQDADHRISSAVTQSFKADRQYSVPKATGEVLIKQRKVAEAVTANEPSSEKET